MIQVRSANQGLPSSDLPPAPIATIDITPFTASALETSSSSAEERTARMNAQAKVILSVQQAAMGNGFMNITGHGIAPSVFSNFHDALVAFFNLPVKAKVHCCDPGNSSTARGYTKFQAENAAAVFGRVSPADLKEAFDFGPPSSSSSSSSSPSSSPPSLASSFSAHYDYGSNLYPDASLVPHFRQAVHAYYKAMEGLEKTLFCIFTHVLARVTGHQLSSDFLASQIYPFRGLLRANYYPALPTEKVIDQVHDETRLGAHTDSGPFTILWTQTPGLEVCLPKGEEKNAREVDDEEIRSNNPSSPENRPWQWRAVPVVAGALTINVADQLRRWSNGLFYSCIHRVNAMVNPSSPRLSIAYFPTQMLPSPDQVAKDPVITPLCREGDKCRYAPLEIRKYLERQFQVFKNKEEEKKPTEEEGGEISIAAT